MQMGNLLSYKQSFCWDNTNADRGASILDLNDALDTARSFGDLIFRSSDFFGATIGDSDFFQFIYETQYDEKKRQEVLPWLTQLQHNTLIYLLSFFQNTTSDGANSLADLYTEFPDDNNGLVGLACDNNPDRYVKCVPSWRKWHSNYVMENALLRHENYSYYKEFHDGELATPLNQIQQQISNNQVDDFFDSIHTPKIPHEKIHIHFINGSALNIDGSWKHLNDKKDKKIPLNARKQLLDWGFVLPSNYE
jgi:hypothetical protein